MVNGVKSSWQPVISGCPQGSILIFDFFLINDLEKGIECTFSHIVGEGKLGKRADLLDGTMALQKDLSRLD